ncbi:MAG: AAA family ATPase [Rhodospirillaceae bacterium]|nr:AAA family ATPase [Rhodospirillaceae bacterium]
MDATDQSQIIDFLSRPETYGAAGPVETIETHISVVFLIAGHAYKLKRAVTYPYLDFSTLAARKKYCEAEVTVNRRTAPELYKGTVAVTRNKNGRLALGGAGDVVDWLVEMARFDQDTLFDRLAVAGKLDSKLMGELATNIARFHENAALRPDADTRKGLATTVIGNAATFEVVGPGILDMDAIAAMTAASMDMINGACGDLLDERRRRGRVRHCHGDLHLRNIFLDDGHPTLFDAIEFKDTFADIDVLYDLSFLLMDLDHRGLRRLANIALNRYLDITDDSGGLWCLPLFLNLRAMIRAHVAATTSAADDSRSYLALASDYLNPPPPCLIAVGGLSGSGKSHLGRELAPYIGAAPGARVARSDVLRKRLAGVDALTRLAADGYTAEMTLRTYRAVYDEARTALAAGQSVIADAVFALPEQRRAIAAVAEDLAVPFHGLWLEAPPEVMMERAANRRNNASDADEDVVRNQLSYDLGTIDWTHIDSSGPARETLDKGLFSIGLKAHN